MPKIIMLRGYPASGKTTYAKEYITKNPDWIRINKDDLRSMFSPLSYNWAVGTLVYHVQNAIIEKAMLRGHNIILDNTHMGPEPDRYLRIIVDDFNSRIKELQNDDLTLHTVTPYQIKIVDMGVDFEECVRRDSLREKSLGENAMRAFKARFDELNRKHEENKNTIQKES